MKKLLLVVFLFSTIHLSFAQTSEEYFKQGAQKYKEQDYKGAIIEHNKAIEINPGFIKAYLARAVCKYYIGDFNGALSDVDAAIKINPENANPYCVKALLIDLRARNLEQKKTNVKVDSLYAEAIMYFTLAIKLDPSLLDAYLNRGDLYTLLKKDTLAIEDYTSVILLDPTRANVYLSRSTSYYELKKYNEAIEDCNKAIGISPNYVDAYIMRANLKNLNKDYDGAIADYSQLIKIDPEDKYTYYQFRGIAKSGKLDHAGAIADLTTCISLNPNDVDLYTERARSYLLLSDYKSGIADFTKIISLEPSNATTYIDRASAKLILKDYSSAIKDYTTAIQLDLLYEMVYFYRAQAEMANKKQVEAITDLNTFIQLSGSSFNQTANLGDTTINYTSQAYMVRSFAKYEMKDYQGALDDINIYLSVPSNSAPDYLFRGKLYAHLNNHSDAILDFNKAIEIDPSYDQAYMHRGISKTELNQNDACSDLLKAKELGLKAASQYLKKYCH